MAFSCITLFLKKTATNLFPVSTLLQVNLLVALQRIRNDCPLRPLFYSANYSESERKLNKLFGKLFAENKNRIQEKKIYLFFYHGNGGMLIVMEIEWQWFRIFFSISPVICFLFPSPLIHWDAMLLGEGRVVCDSLGKVDWHCIFVLISKGICTD